MYRILLALIAALGIAGPVVAQFNTTLVGQLDYPQELNDVWGWVAPDGTEYALVGTQTGVSIVSLADPANPVQVAFFPGSNSAWRDLKTWGNYAYTVTDQPGSNEGLNVIDLSRLPDTATLTRWNPVLPGQPGPIGRCHNLYVDEHGFAYLSGCSGVNAGGIIYVDVHTTPGTPIFAGLGAQVYSHDVYVRDNYMFTSEINQGRFSIYNVTDKQETIKLNEQTTPFFFTHNTWLSDDGKTLFTTDERGNAPIGAYDISDLEDITFLDEYRPFPTLGQGVIPHNVHVKDDFLYISYYTDGLIIVDASRPHNMVEVGQYDSSKGFVNGFHGAWGAYPFLPSGLILASDIENGLFVVRPNVPRAAWLEGMVTDAQTGQSLGAVQVNLSAQGVLAEETSADGNFATGTARAGSYEVTFTREGYLPKTETVTLVNGELTTLNVALQPLLRLTVNGQVVTGGSSAGVPYARVLLVNEQSEFTIQAGADGFFDLTDVYEGSYQVYAGAWGYRQRYLGEVDVVENRTLTISLEPGSYEDDFILDLGWTTTADSAFTTTGFWERAEPLGITYNGQFSNPEVDADGDLGDQAYVTENRGAEAADFDVDGGYVYLISPVMDLSGMEQPLLSFDYWFFNSGGNSTPNDQLSVTLVSPADTITVDFFEFSFSRWRNSPIYDLNELELNRPDAVRIVFQTGDLTPGHLLEAGVDVFRVVDGMANPVTSPIEGLHLTAAPNPFAETSQLRYQLPDQVVDAQAVVTNSLGQVLTTYELSNQTGVIEIGGTLSAGIYFVQIVVDGRPVEQLKLVKN